MKKTRLITIFIIVFIDMLGFSLILPLLPYYAETFNIDVRNRLKFNFSFIQIQIQIACYRVFDKARHFSKVLDVFPILRSARFR